MFGNHSFSQLSEQMEHLLKMLLTYILKIYRYGKQILIHKQIINNIYFKQYQKIKYQIQKNLISLVIVQLDIIIAINTITKISLYFYLFLTSTILVRQNQSQSLQLLYLIYKMYLTIYLFFLFFVLIHKLMILKKTFIAFSKKNNTYNVKTAKTSRQIELEMRQLKWKSSKTDFTSIDSKFGKVKPNTISVNFPKPPTFQYNLQSLRLCSRSYPQYLLNQLNNPSSPFNSLIKKILEDLWKAEKKEALQLLQFIKLWKLNDEGLTDRVLDRLDLDMIDIFEILKWQNYSETIENLIIRRLTLMNPSEYQPLFKIINYLRFNDLTSDTFFMAIERNLQENIKNIPPSALVQIAIHYAHNTKENHDTKINILNIIRKKLIDVLKFLTHDQLLAIIYSYFRADLVSQQLSTAITIRLQLIYSQLNHYNRKRVFQILLSFSQIQRMRLLGIIQHEYLSKKTAHFSILGDMLLASFECNMLTQEIAKMLHYQIIQNILNMESEDVCKCIWVFYRTAPKKQCDLLSRKIQIIIEGGLSNYSLKEVSVIVWGLCVYNYQPSAKFWNNIEDYIQQSLSKDKFRTPDNCSYILWAYLNNRALKVFTIRIITNIIMEKHQQIQPFMLCNIIAFYYSIEMEEANQIRNLAVNKLGQVCRKMTGIEVLRCLRYVYRDISNVDLEKIIQILLQCFQELSYRDLLSCFGLIMRTKHKSIKKEKLIIKLSNKIKELESLTN